MNDRNIRRSYETVPSRHSPGETYERPVVEVKCCGQWMRVTGRFTTTCDDCGPDYNGNGSRLAPREQWGEETGEHWSECY